MLALIPARGGSKGIARKNLVPLGGLPLLNWTINSALECFRPEDTFVSTEDGEIRWSATQAGVEVIDRPPDLATDSATTDSVIDHAIAEIAKTRDMTNEVIVLLQPTSPLRAASSILAALTAFEENAAAKMVMSVMVMEKTPFKAYKKGKTGELIPLLGADSPFQPRQELPLAYLPDGAIYVFRVSEFSRDKRLPRTNIFPFLMPKNESMDIDTLEDVRQAEELLLRGVVDG